MPTTTMPDWKIGGGFGGGFGGPANFDSMDRFEVGGFGRREFTTHIPWITFETTQLPTTTLKTPKSQGQSKAHFHWNILDICEPELASGSDFYGIPTLGIWDRDF